MWIICTLFNCGIHKLDRFMAVCTKKPNSNKSINGKRKTKIRGTIYTVYHHNAHSKDRRNILIYGKHEESLKVTGKCSM